MTKKMQMMLDAVKAIRDGRVEIRTDGTYLDGTRLRSEKVERAILVTAKVMGDEARQLCWRG